MNVYLAGASSELDLCKRYRNEVQKMGHTITLDWMQIIESVGAPNPTDATDFQRKKWSHSDLSAVKQAEVVWIVVPKKTSIGCWVEMGYALAQRETERGIGNLVVCSGDDKRSIFTAMCDFSFPEHDTCLAWLRDVANDHVRKFVQG